MANKSRATTWLTILIVTSLGISVSPHRILTRTGEVSRALSPVLSSYEVIRMEPDQIERQVRTTGELRFRFNETDFYFNLEPHDMRAPNYRAVETGPGGVSRTLPPQPVHTFKGVLAGREDTQGRFNLTDSGVEGVVYVSEGRYYVEPLRNYLPSAPAGELVVYRQSDIKSGDTFKCGVSLPMRLQRGINRVTAQVEAASFTTPTNYVFDVATEADYEYVRALGGSAAANREILGILNQVEGVYQSELLLQLRISFQNTWNMQDDPYTTANASDLLDEFIEYWNDNFAAEQDYDLSHLWTGRVLEDGIAGLAETGVVCNARSYSYALSSHQTTVPQKYTTPAHEIGHNFGAVHPNEQNPPVEGCTNTIMAISTFFQRDVDKAMTFCEFSRQEIAAHVAGNNSCLTTQPITLQPPSSLSAAAVSSSGIDLTWQDNSTNEIGFVVHYRLGDSAEWLEIGTTAANATTFSSGGLSPGFTYRYRVRAFNDLESSAFSNEALATTQPDQQTGTEWRIDTIAGGGIGDGGPAVQALLDSPYGVAVDRVGNLYIVDNDLHRIRRVDTNGTITTIAGTGDGGYSGDGGPAAQAQLRWPLGMAVDNHGNLYIADQGNHRVRRVDVSGTITTVAGNGSDGYSGDGGPAIRAQLNRPRRVAVDGDGVLYISDGRNHCIRRVDASGTITTIAGTGIGGYSGDGGPAHLANLYNPWGVAVDGSGNLYIADVSNDRIRRVDVGGTIRTIAGNGSRGHSGDGGLAVQAQLAAPVGVALDSNGILYIADWHNNRIRRVDTSGTITTIAGIGPGTFGGDNGPAQLANLYNPQDVAVDGSGNVYIADLSSGRIRQVNTSGTITTVAGAGRGSYGGDNGPATRAQLARPQGVAVDPTGILYISDTGNHRIRRVDVSGTITTIAGTGEAGYSGDGSPAHLSRLNSPRGIGLDRAGNLFIADLGNGCVRRIDAKGTISTVAGTGESGYYSGDGGPARLARLSGPQAVAVDRAGNLYIADGSALRRVDATGTITTIAGTEKSGYSGDGGPAVEAQLGGPTNVAVDRAGNLYIADSSNQRIRRVDVPGTITNFAGNGRQGRSGDGGPAVAARLTWPRGVALDSAGNLYIADTGNQRIRRVDTRGIIRTIAGTGRRYFGGDGGPAVEAWFRGPYDLVVSSVGDVYVADTDNHRIRVLTQLSSLPPNPPTLLTATPVSFQEIKLSWQDNSTNETGFKVQRQVDGSAAWVEIGTTAANATTFSDTGLKPTTTYHYRVRAFNNSGASTFSNEAFATTLEAFPPTLIGFMPTSGPVGTQVTLTGTRFLGATDVRFNGVSSLSFEVVSMTTIRAVVPPGTTSGRISVLTPAGTALSADLFTVTVGGTGSRLFVPVLLTSAGRNNSYFTSELTLTNRGSEAATLHYTYTADQGGGSGTATEWLAAGRQIIKSNAIVYLTGLGIPIPRSGNRVGTLTVEVSGSSGVSVVTRTTTAVPEGRAGLAYPGIADNERFQEAVYLCGLRENRQDRSNVAVQHMGSSEDGPITLRTTVYSGEPDDTRSHDVGEVELKPGGFHQFDSVLKELGSPAQGYVKVERVEGRGPFYAYGVINDNFNSDGSFVFPLTESSLAGTTGQTLPVIIETGNFQSELTVTNFSASEKTVDFSFVADAIHTAGDTTTFSLRLKAGEQNILPNVVNWLRRQSVAGIGPAGRAFVGALFATLAEGDMSGIVIGARTGSPDKKGGQYSLFYNGVPFGSASVESAWIYGLQQNAENRSNLALVNTGEIDGSSSTLEITIYDGSGESQPITKRVTLGPRRWRQENGILGSIRQGYVHVRKTSGNNPFVTYGVINDGGRPGERSGDGAFLLSQE